MASTLAPCHCGQTRRSVGGFSWTVAEGSVVFVILISSVPLPRVERYIQAQGISCHCSNELGEMCPVHPSLLMPLLSPWLHSNAIVEPLEESGRGGRCAAAAGVER